MFREEKAYRYLLGGMLLGILALSFLSLIKGSLEIEAKTVFSCILAHIQGKDVSSFGYLDFILWELRLPRILLALLAGASLSLAGLLMQCLTQNPLASPYILGISSGASTGAVIALLCLPWAWSLPLLAFVMAILTVCLVFFLAGRHGFTNTKLILVGVALSSFFSALTTLCLVLSSDDRKIRDALFWLTGSLAAAHWEAILPMAGALLLACCILFPKHRELNILLSGEEAALVLGLSLKSLRRCLIVLSSLLVSYVISHTGIIGFVGLVVPHMARKLVGEDHKKLLPLSLLLGAFFLLASDFLTRCLFPLQEVPIGILCSLLGVPFFLYLLLGREGSL